MDEDASGISQLESAERLGGAMVIFVRQIHAKWPLRLRLEKVFPFQRAYSRSLAPRFKNRRPWADRRRDHLAKRS